MYEVLVPVDQDEERAKHQAEYVASLPGAGDEVRATVLYVTPREEYSDGPRDFEEVDSAVAAADELEGAGVSVERAAAVGTVSREIIDHADEIDADQIVMGGRKRSGVAKVLVGSSTQDVIYSTERPVVVTG
jgi:nucleotide-binding universal stress UspA family protein